MGAGKQAGAITGTHTFNGADFNGVDFNGADRCPTYVSLKSPQPEVLTNSGCGRLAITKVYHCSVIGRAFSIRQFPIRESPF
ncbi:MAG: hypothetical protein AAGE92_08495 [Cyanobacteria bacterium P01_G01_bin.4]